MSECPIPLDAISANLRKHVDPKSPLPLRLMASKGMVPMGPRDMLCVLSALCFDSDEKIASSARKSLQELPDKIAMGALKEALPPTVLDHVARLFDGKETYLEAILINPATQDGTFAWLGSRVGERLLTIIAQNQVRILRTPDVARAILNNPSVRKSVVDDLMDFAVRTGMDFKGLDAFNEAKVRIQAAPPNPAESKRILKIVEASLPDELIEEFDEAVDALAGEEQAVVEKKKQNVLAMLMTMTPAQKVVLAQKGNRGVRLALLKDPNKVVATTAIKAPGYSESDILSVASSRAVCDDVIRIISSNREWTRSYAIRLALVQNPKTPIVFAMRFLNTVNATDLKRLSSNKNIPSAVAQAGKRLLQKRQGH